jgi:hypothetical protein
MAVAQVPPVPKATGGPKKPQPRLHVETRSHDLGKISDGDRPAITWKLENRGDADLIIEKTQSTCGCTVVQLADDQKRIPPGGSIELKAAFDSKGRRGEQNKKIGVFTNDPAQPELTLEFHALVEALYEIDPPGMLNLRAVQRGKEAEKMIVVWPSSGHKQLEIKSFEFDSQVPLSHTIDSFIREEGVTGQRIHLTVSEAASLGPLMTTATLKLVVDGVERIWPIPIRADVVSDLTWTPLVLDASRQVLVPGRQLAPVTIRSSEKAAFDVVKVTAGPLLEATFEQLSEPPARSAFSVYLTLAKETPPGPFAASLQIQTTSLDQPLIEVPVFGIVTAPLQADPGIVLLRPDGTPAGTQRRVKLQADPTAKLEVSSAKCDNPAVSVTVDTTSTRQPAHVAFIKAELKNPSKAAQDATIRVTTNIAGYESFAIPVVIEAAQDR